MNLNKNYDYVRIYNPQWGKHMLVSGKLHYLMESRHGFEVYHTGGGCFAWSKTLADASYIMITDDVSLGTWARRKAPVWSVGRYDDKHGWVCWNAMATLAQALEIGARLPAPASLGESAENLIDDESKLLPKRETPLPGKLAVRFRDLLREAMSRNQWKEMRRRNATEEYRNCCASHDFVDSNVIMARAWIALVDWDPVGTDYLTTAQTDVWNKAWDIAKRRYLTEKTRQ